MPVTLTYFDMPGRAEAIRLTFNHGNLEFKDNRITFEEFGANKAKGVYPNGQVPVLTLENGEMISQTGAILYYAGKLAKLYPECPTEALRVDEVLFFLDEYLEGLKNCMQTPADQQAAAYKAWVEGDLAAKNKLMEAWLAKSPKGFLANDKLSIADFKFFGMINFTKTGFRGVPTECLDSCPAIKAFYERIQNIPSVAAYYKNSAAN